LFCDAVRTPIGRYGGALAAVRTDDLAAIPIRALVERNRAVDWSRVNDVILGCANQAGEDNRNVARMAALLAGLPVDVSGTTVNRLCGSGMEAVAQAARAIKTGEAHLVIAGGVECMSRAPFVMPKATSAFSRNAEIYDTTIGWRFVNPLLKQAYGVDSMPQTSDNVAAEFEVSRADQDAFAYRSQMRAKRARAEGCFAEEIVPVRIAGRRETVTISIDEHPRPETTLEGLARLPALFGERSSVTAGNASGVNDGAAALIVASEAAVKEFNLTPRARVLRRGHRGRTPSHYGSGARAGHAKGDRSHPGGARHDRRNRTERSVRVAIPCRPAPVGTAGRRRARQSQWRRDCAGPSAGHERRAPGAYRDSGTREAQGAVRALHDVYWGRPGDRFDI
jgi:acetyl-CoA acyltransferase